MTNQTIINQFWKLQSAQKSCALDINSKTGELALRATKSNTGEIGNGTPPVEYTENWSRIILCLNGVLQSN